MVSVSDPGPEGAAAAVVTVTELGGGRYLVETGQIRRLAQAVVIGTQAWVYLDGATFVIDDRPVVSRARVSGSTEAELSAPMPATVIAVAITPGQRVSSGEILIRLEAMKMELPIIAPRDGIVRAVACRVGDLVQPGIPLVTFEAP